MYKVVEGFPVDLIFKKSDRPYISIYQPTHRYMSPEKEQDQIRFKNLIAEVENSLSKDFSRREVEEIIKPLITILEDKTFWNTTYEGGVAVLSVDGETIIYRLKRDIKEIAIVSDSFHIKPLIRTFQSADRYHILGINMKKFVLYEGNRYGIDKIEFDEEVPTTIEEVLGDEFTDKYLSAGSYKGPGQKGIGAIHGHGSKKDEVEIDNERFFRYIDKFIETEFSNPTKMPLILVGLEEHQAIFRKFSQNNYLIKDGLKLNFEAIDRDELEKRAWNKMLPIYEEKTKDAIEAFNDYRAQDKGSEDLAQVVRAATENRIGLVLLESDKIIPGKIDLDKGSIIEGDLEDPRYDDLLDDLAEIVLENGGQVIMLPKEKMPSNTGVAAIYRY